LTVSQEDVELVIRVFSVAGEPRVEMGALMRNDELWRQNQELFSDDVQVRFVNPSDGGVQIMEQEFRGVDGLREGWGVWMQPWDEFHVSVEDLVDAGDGRVVVLASALGKMRGTGAELPQEVATLCRVEDGRIVEVDFYLDQAQARRDAGLLG
jgi:ketosteroid isomerase-like protein